MRRSMGEHSADGKLLEEIAYTLNAPKEDGTTAEFARVQITPTRGGKGTLLAFAQEWKTGALNNSHLLLHSTQGDTAGNAGGFGEGFKVAANSLLARFPHSSAEPCQILMVMNGRTWRFCYRNFETDCTAASSVKIDQFVVDEYTTNKVYGGMVVFVEIPMAATSLERIWNPDHYVPTMSLATWTPLLPPGASPVTSYVLFLEDSEVPSKFFQLGIYVGTVDNSKGAFFNEGGSVDIGRDRADTSDVLSNIRSAIETRVTLWPAGTRDDAVMERLMVNPDALGQESRHGSRVLYKSVLSYIRSRDRVPDATEILLVGAEIASKVTECLSGAQLNVHVVSAEKELWTYASNEDVSKALMAKTFSELFGAERQCFQVELQVLATISPWAAWVPGVWPGTVFQECMGQSKRYFEDKVLNRHLVPTVALKDPEFAGLCMDAWILSKLDPYIFMQRIGSDSSILRDPNRMITVVEKAREQAASGNRLFVSVDSNRDLSPERVVPPKAVFVFGGTQNRPPNNFTAGSAIDPANSQPPSAGGPSFQPSGGMADQPLWFPPPTLKDPSGLSIGGQSGQSDDIIDSVDEEEETRFKLGPLRCDLGVELFVAQGVSDPEAEGFYGRFMSTPGVKEALDAIRFTANSFFF
ncbi:unnamed protein product, partial [Ectocarpus fasciculatus]